MITDFGTKRKRKIRLLIQIVKNRSFISRKAEKSDLILKKWRKAKFVKYLKTAKMQSCFEILEFIAKRILYKSFTACYNLFIENKQAVCKNGISARGRGSGKTHEGGRPVRCDCKTTRFGKHQVLSALCFQQE